MVEKGTRKSLGSALLWLPRSVIGGSQCGAAFSLLEVREKVSFEPGLWGGGG